MKIEYVNKQPTQNPTLADLKPGEVFRPANSRHVFICCDLNGENRLLSSFASDVWRHITLLGSEPFECKEEFDEDHDYDELIVCVSLTTGNATLLYSGIEVERVNCKLLVEGD